MAAVVDLTPPGTAAGVTVTPGQPSAPGRSLLARASVLAPLDDPRAAATRERVVAAGVRGALTTWVQVGAAVRRLAGRRADPERDVDRLFALVSGLAEVAVGGRGLPQEVSPQARLTSHVRLLATPLRADEALDAVADALRPWTTTSSATVGTPVSVGYFALRDLLAVRARHFSLQVVHVPAPTGGSYQLSLQLPRATPLDALPVDEPGPVQPALWLERLATAAGLRAVPTLSEDDLAGSFGVHGSSVGASHAALAGGRALVRSVLAATAPAALTTTQALELVGLALGRLSGSRTAPRAATPPLAERGMLGQVWEVAVDGHLVPVTAVVRPGGRRFPTQVVLTLDTPALDVPALEAGSPAPPAPAADGGTRPAGAEGDPAEVALAHDLVGRHIWWRSVGGRLDGDDVILYEAVVAGRRLRVRANDYPHEPMYTLLVGPHGLVTAALDLERWPVEWTRPVLS